MTTFTACEATGGAFSPASECVPGESCPERKFLLEWGKFQMCFTGETGSVEERPECWAFDFDGDGDVDLDDYAAGAYLPN